jgi:hypothetical protein
LSQRIPKMSFQGVLHRLSPILNASRSVQFALTLFIAVPALSLILLAATYVYTNLRYRLAVVRINRLAAASKPQVPPPIPYTIPFVGCTLDFVYASAGEFWSSLFAKYPRSSLNGSCSIMLGGQATHILFDPTAVEALFRAKGPMRDRLNYMLSENSLGIARPDVMKYWGVSEPTGDEKDRDPRFATSDQQFEYLLRNDKVKELTAGFMQQLKQELRQDGLFSDGTNLEAKVNIVHWLRDHMFVASTHALYGSRLFEIYPELVKDMWDVDEAMVPLLAGLPTFMMPQHYAARARAIAGMLRWHEAAWRECKGQPLEPNDKDWEPIYGSRFNRARQRFYMHRGITTHTKAAADLGILFGLASNAIPAASWMLLHILDPNGDKTLLPRLLKELQSAKDGDEVNVSTLVSLPLFQSILQEVLRLYTDMLVARDIPADLQLPAKDGKRLQLRKGDLVLAPSWICQHDEEEWAEPSTEVFYAERFLKRDPETGQDSFSMNGTAGKLFPFGGGKTICPGRVFAKQEVLGAVATVLLNYDVEPINFVDKQGKEADKFPTFERRFAGSGVLPVDGDLQVKIKRRT